MYSKISHAQFKIGDTHRMNEKLDNTSPSARSISRHMAPVDAHD